jgi:hypothetical protein
MEIKGQGEEGRDLESSLPGRAESVNWWKQHKQNPFLAYCPSLHYNSGSKLSKGWMLKVARVRGGIEAAMDVLKHQVSYWMLFNPGFPKPIGASMSDNTSYPWQMRIEGQGCRGRFISYQEASSQGIPGAQGCRMLQKLSNG